MKKYSLLLIALLISLGLFADITIGDRYSGSYFPFDSTAGYSRCANLYLASEIEASGTITHLSWEVWTLGTYAVDTPVKIYLTTTNAMGLVAETWEYYSAGLTPVYEGIARFDQLGWYTFDITDFEYDYTTDGNLLVLTEQNMGGNGIYPDQPFFACHLPDGIDGFVYWQSDGTPPTGVGSTWFVIRPDIRIHGISVGYVPAPVTLGGPADGATGVGILPNLTWAPTTGSPSGYDLYFGEDEPVEGNYVMSHESMTGLSWNPGVLNFSTTYYWKVVPWNVNGHPEFELCPTWSFTTQDDTTQPIPYFQDFESASSIADINWTGSMQIGNGMGVDGSKGLYRWFAWANIVNVDATTNPIGPISSDIELKFDYRLAYGDWLEPTVPMVMGPNDKIEVKVSNDFGLTYTTVYTINSTNHVTTANFLNRTIDLSAFTSGYIMIKFYATFYDMYNFDYYDYLTFDNVRVQEIDTIPVFSYTPNNMSFGYIQTGNQSTPQNVQITNTGGGVINLSTANISIIGANASDFGFSTVNLPASLGASQMVNIPVYAAPLTTGSKTATLRIAFGGNNYDVALSATGIEPGTVVIGTGTENQNLPVYPFYGYTYSQSIYPAAEINYNVPGHRIQKIAYYWNGGVGTLSSGWTVYMGHTSLSSFANTTSWVPVSQLTQVYTGNIGIPTAAGWVEITLDTPFTYNGTSNLIIAVDENTPNYDGGSQYFRCSSAMGNRSILYYSDSTNPNPASPPTASSVKAYYPNLMLKFVEPPTTPVFNITPEAWDFGRAIVNMPVTKNFVITNNGAGSLEVNSITISGAGFTLVSNPAPVSLGLAQSATFTVKFQPTTVGNYTGSVIIGYGSTSFTVNLSGTAFDPVIRTFPYLQNFDGDWTGTPPAPLNWNVVNANNDSYTWRRANTYITPTHSTPYAAYGSGNTNDWLISPPIDLSNTYVAMKWWDKVEGASQTHSYRVYVSTTTNQTSAFTTQLMDITCSNTAWTEHTLNLAPYYGQTIFVAFHQYASYSSSWGFGIDDFLLEAIPTDPIFSYSPESLNFGLSIHGVASQAKNVTITNLGVGAINVAAADISIFGPNATEFSFSTANLPASLGPMQSVIIPVQVTPQTVGPISATLRIVNQGTNYDVALSASGLPQGTVIIGNGTTNMQMPVNPYYGYTYSQSIYLQSALNTSNRRIEKIAYYWNGAGAGNYTNQWTIYMGHTPNFSFDSTTSWVPVSQMTEVYSGELNIPATPGWIEVTLDEPFIYNNVNNLVVTVYESKPSYDGSSQFFYSTAAGDDRSLRFFSDGENPNPLNPPEGTLVRGFPNAMFVFGNIPTTPVPMVTPASLDFGGNFQHEPTAWQYVNVRNSGVGILSLSASDISIIGSSASMYEVNSSSLPFALATGESAQIPVRFTATDSGIRTATLRITYAGVNYDVALSGSAYPEGMFIIGTGTDTQRQPFGTFFGHERSAALYTAADIGRYGSLELVSWNVATTNPNNIPYKIYAGTTTASQLTAVTWNNLIAGLTLVKQGTYQFGSLGWHSFFLDTPIELNGENLIIAVESNVGGSGSGNYSSFTYTNAGINSHMYWQRDGEPPIVEGYLNSYRPNLMLYVQEVAPAEPTLLSPAPAATELPIIGFNMSWQPNVVSGGMPTYYTVFMAHSEDDIYSEYAFETTNTTFNPVTEEGMVFGYGERWYWTVQAINGAGDAIAPIRWFEIQTTPTELDTPVITITQTATGPLHLSWAAITGATHYKVYVSADPYAADPWTLLGTVNTPGYDYTGTMEKAFFKVIAIEGLAK